ncbi:MAG: hypothetical protein COV69_03760 [Parcubacteria group bacterium CG11_big_fil_rev_8_21_14_0_20_39_14]|nr:MAG: hypothetical protein COV69_03760 [Parcubacteria group bacterium CG11_big_fil_rev_8_21_14_0_20_39_14]PIS35184.1 MAG: hypothetical protein COT36_03790 [Parcubacteria group bacterium CG08_land_8_20_14_0_20_38_56]
MKSIKKIKNQLISEMRQLKDRKGFIRAGLPRFGRLFGRDSLIVSWQLLNYDPEICRKTLEILSKFQGKKFDKLREEEPGKILHETEPKRKWHLEGYAFPYYGSVDSTPLYLILFDFYFWKTKDKKFIQKYWKNILKALDWMEKYGDIDGDGFLEYQRKTPRGRFHQGWKDWKEDPLNIQPPVAVVEAQGYQYLALKEIARLARVIKDINLTKKLEKRARRLKIDFNKKFWMEDKKYFAFALDGRKNQIKKITSNSGHLLFTGICQKDKEKLIIKRLFQQDLWTPFGIRTHSSLESDFDPLDYHFGSVWPHDNWLIAQGLKKLGYKKEYQKIKKALLRAYWKLGKIPELYGVLNNQIVEIPQACHLQAWATGALLNFLSN